MIYHSRRAIILARILRRRTSEIHKRAFYKLLSEFSSKKTSGLYECTNELSIFFAPIELNEVQYSMSVSYQKSNRLSTRKFLYPPPIIQVSRQHFRNEPSCTETTDYGMGPIDSFDCSTTQTDEKTVPVVRSILTALSRLSSTVDIISRNMKSPRDTSRPFTFTARSLS